MKIHYAIRIEVDEGTETDPPVLWYTTALCAGTRWVTWPRVAFGDFEAVTCKRCRAANERMAREAA